MHDVPHRQLIAHAVVLIFVFAASRVNADEEKTANVGEQLQTAKLMQAALAARGGTPEERKKLDAQFAALVAESPRDANVRDARAEFLWEMGEPSRAIAEWETAEQLDPKNPLVLEHLGVSALALDETRKSAAYYSRSLATDPANARGHFALANIWFLFRHELIDASHPDAENLLQGALAHFAEAARLSPANAEYARAYAEMFYSVAQPDWTAALTAWESFQRVSPQQDFALLHLARVHLKLGQREAAKNCLSKVQNAEYQTLKARLEAQVNAHPEVQSKSASLRP